MDKINERVSKRHLRLPALAILLAVLAIGCGQNHDGKKEEVAESEVALNNPLLDKWVQDYNTHLIEEKRIEAQRRFEKQKRIEEKKRIEKQRIVALVKKEKRAEEEKAKAISYSEEDLYWLARVVSSEAKGESEKGQIAVANVVLNRVKSENFEDTIRGVVFQKNQFSGVIDKSIYKEPTKEAIESAKKALNGERVIDKNVYYFYNPRTATSRWLDGRKVAVDIGNHRFTY